MSDQDASSSTNTRKLKTYREARMQNTENLRKLVVDAAATLLQEEGPEAVTVRKVSQKMNCSTKIIYSLFVNKEGLGQQLYLDGCKLLANEFERTLQAADPAQHMLNFGETFWQFGQHYSSYYKLMFGGAFADFKPDGESMRGTVTAMSQLLTVISNAQEQGLISGQYDTESTPISERTRNNLKNRVGGYSLVEQPTSQTTVRSVWYTAVQPFKWKIHVDARTEQGSHNTLSRRLAGGKTPQVAYKAL